MPKRVLRIGASVAPACSSSAGLRWWRPLWGLALVVGLAASGGCGTAPPRTHFDSHASYDRSFDIALGAMADQRLIFSVQDRRHGRIVGTVDGSTLVATIEPTQDGMFRVVFAPQGDSPADAALLSRVGASYNERMAKLSLLGGFKDAEGSSAPSGPKPCASGPAFCP